MTGVSDPSMHRRLLALEQRIQQLTTTVDRQASSLARSVQAQQIWIGRTVAITDEDYPTEPANTYRVELLSPGFDETASGAVAWPDGTAGSPSYKIARGTVVLAQVIPWYETWLEEEQIVVLFRQANFPEADVKSTKGGWWIVGTLPPSIMMASKAEITYTSGTLNALDFSGGGITNVGIGFEANGTSGIKCIRDGYYQLNATGVIESTCNEHWQDVTLQITGSATYDFKTACYVKPVAGAGSVRRVGFGVSGITDMYVNDVLTIVAQSIDTITSGTMTMKDVLISAQFLRAVAPHRLDPAYVP
jgi:hypothetical protein